MAQTLHQDFKERVSAEVLEMVAERDREITGTFARSCDGAYRYCFDQCHAIEGFSYGASVYLNFTTNGTLNLSGLLLGSIIIGILGAHVRLTSLWIRGITIIITIEIGYTWINLSV